MYYRGLVVRRNVDIRALDGFLCVPTLVEREFLSSDTSTGATMAQPVDDDALLCDGEIKGTLCISIVIV